MNIEVVCQSGAMPRRPSVTDGMTNADKLVSGVERGLIRLLITPAPEFPNFPAGHALVVPGPKGHARYVINIRDRLKQAGFAFDPETKAWFKATAEAALVEGF